MKALTYGLVLSAAALLAAGCSQGGTTTADGKPVPNLAFVSYLDTDYQQAELEGLNAVVEPSGGSVTMFNANFDTQKQQQQCQDAVTSRRYAAIVLATFDGTGAPCVAVAKAAGIPVVVIENFIGNSPDDFTPQVPGVVGTAIITKKGNADAVVAMTKQACAGIDPCKVIAEVANPTDYFSNGAVEAIESELPNVEIVQKFTGNYEPAQIARQLPAILAAQPDATVLLTSADFQALAAVPVVAEAGRADSIKILGNSGSRAGAAAVADGSLYATTGNFPKATAEAIAKMAVQAINDETVSPNGLDALTLGKPLVVTKENINEFTPEWGPAPAAG